MGREQQSAGSMELEKKKKRKKKSVEDDVVAADVEETVDEGSKKQKVDATNGAGEAAVTGDKKKKKKKEKKQGSGDESAEEVTKDSDNGATKVENGEGKKKKSKKDKSGGDDDANAKSKSSQVAEKVELFVGVSGVGSDDPKFKPFTSFDIPGVPENVLACCKTFQKPSPIQANSWPFLLAGRDLIGIAATGSGKTLAFGVPGMSHVLKKKAKSKSTTPLALVMAPTRELTQQIAEVLEEAGSSCGVKIACIYGGTPKGPQKAALRAGATVIVATPGRLQDLMEEGVCSLEQVSFVVLDEADRMLDLGFEPAIRAIISKTNKVRQTLMFSATWPTSVDQLAKEFMQENPIKVTVGSQDLAANHDVMQIVEVLEDRARFQRLDALLAKYHKSRTNRVIVFVLYKKEAARVEQQLQSRGWKVAAVHGDKGQNDRTRAVQSFRDGSCPLLVATDVAARGLDIPDVEFVINFSFPLTVEDYVHRIGRTGRAGKKGVAHTFFTQADKLRAGELVNVLREAGQIVPDELLKFGTHVKKKESKLYGAHFKEIDTNAPKAKKITFDDSDDE
ncbi:ATP-dependent RNA helicase DBP3 [Marchantia polymorpha subsp. ruderalis]|uniref:RNA helicase n=2 Tax=Marchantia polymorpha TaxID=3197 RepID=A0A176WLM4_MARPO|nr:hypothetical protein AXG93_1467s1250 [Marchantia polymorpha subsp. ruderalis]PTQ39499.1 hypothetical protein MARPO_0045s0142 [Marchantia polymorpha]BBN15389.1 hypothetical protein Mp_6g19210 [Marchantia polymorpha subsp. ruderalis]|eukprot:PTQ39499.1 hypothetical protein MARPO_0045s0142 [Marchantia polymorpha]